MTKSRVNYEPKVCSCCGMPLTYLLAADRGTVDILKAIATAIRKKGVNCIHPRKEMEISKGVLTYQSMVGEGRLTSNQVGNLSRPRFHGLIARVKGENTRGNYCLTSKGAKFLRGGEIPRYAIISKVKGHKEGYHNPEKYVCTIKDFSPEEDYWDGIDFTIEEGSIIKDVESLHGAQGKLI